MFQRRPIQFTATVDGRPMGRPFRTSGMAHAYADELAQQSPWSVIEVEQVF